MITVEGPGVVVIGPAGATVWVVVCGQGGPGWVVWIAVSMAMSEILGGGFGGHIW